MFFHFLDREVTKRRLVSKCLNIFPLDSQLQIGNQIPQLNQNSQQQQQRQQPQQQSATGQPQQQSQSIAQQFIAHAVPRGTLLPQNYVTQPGQVTK